MGIYVDIMQNGLSDHWIFGLNTAADFGDDTSHIRVDPLAQTGASDVTGRLHPVLGDDAGYGGPGREIVERIANLNQFGRVWPDVARRTLVNRLIAKP